MAKVGLAAALLLCAACADIASPSGGNNYPGPSSPGTQPTPPVIATSSLPDAIAGQSYSYTLVVNGGVSPFAYTVSAGSLPNGLFLGLQTGTISGTTSDTGSYGVTFRVASGNGLNERALTLLVK